MTMIFPLRQQYIEIKEAEIKRMYRKSNHFWGNSLWLKWYLDILIWDHESPDKMGLWACAPNAYVPPIHLLIAKELSSLPYVQLRIRRCLIQSAKARIRLCRCAIFEPLLTAYFLRHVFHCAAYSIVSPQQEDWGCLYKHQRFPWRNCHYHHLSMNNIQMLKWVYKISQCRSPSGVGWEKRGGVGTCGL